MANTDNPHGFLYEGRIGGGPTPILKFRTKSNLTVAKGDPLILETTGLVDLPTASEALFSTLLVGVAAEPVTAVAATQQNILVFCALPDVLFSAQGDNDTAVAQTHIGKQVDMVASTGVYELDLEVTTAKTWEVVGLKPGSAFGTFAELLVVANKSIFQGITS